MPYLHIPQSNLGLSVATVVGKLRGKLAGSIVNQISTSRSKLKQETCVGIKEINKIQQKNNQVSKNLSDIDRTIRRFKNLIRVLKVPLRGLEITKKIILTLPIPQSVPPGFGIPVSITTKYADVLHLIKELIQQLKDDVETIEKVLETPTTAVGKLKQDLSLIDAAAKCCEVGNKLNEELKKGTISKETLKEVGILDEKQRSALVETRLEILGYNAVSSEFEKSLDERDLTGATVDDIIESGLINKFNKQIDSTETESQLTLNQSKINDSTSSPSTVENGVDETEGSLEEQISTFSNVESPVLSNFKKNEQQPGKPNTSLLKGAEISTEGSTRSRQEKIKDFISTLDKRSKERLVDTIEARGETVDSFGISDKVNIKDIETAGLLGNYRDMFPEPVTLGNFRTQQNIDQTVNNFIKTLKEPAKKEIINVLAGRGVNVSELGELTGVSIQDLEKAGMLEEISGLQSIGKVNLNSTEQDIKNLIKQLSPEEKKRLNQAIKSRGTREQSLDKSISRLNSILTKLEKSNIDSGILEGIELIINKIRKPERNEESKKGEIEYTTESGETFILKIKTDDDSPNIATRHYAVAIDKTGIIVLKGNKSFSSDTDVLIEELKLLLENFTNPIEETVLEVSNKELEDIEKENRRKYNESISSSPPEKGTVGTTTNVTQEAGGDADTLNGESGSYYLDYENFTNMSVDYDDLDFSLVGSTVESGSNWDFSSTGIIESILTSSITVSFSNLQKNKILTVILSGNYTVTWPSYMDSGHLISGEYDGTKKNYIQVHCTNDVSGSEEVWWAINTEGT